jgi:replicative DNA helicase
MTQNGKATQLPASNLDAERAVLGSALRDNAVIDDLLLVVGAGDFYTDAHQKLFDVIVALHQAGRPADLVTVAEEMKHRRHVEDAGGYAYIGELWDAAPTAANALHYAAIVKEMAKYRALDHLAGELARMARDRSGPADEALEAAERGIFALRESALGNTVVDAAQAVGELLDYVDECDRRKGNFDSLRTGFVDLDSKTNGFRASSLALIAARPSVGKTALGAAIALNAALGGKPVLFVSLEQNRLELTQRMACSLAKIDSHRVDNGWLNDDEKQRLAVACNAIRRAPLFTADAGAQTVSQIAAQARRLKRRHALAGVFVDYLQFVRPENPRDPRYEQVGQISRQLKWLAKELKIPVVCMAQLNREVEARADPTPRLSDLRESGSLEMDSDTVMLLHRLGPAGGGGHDDEAALVQVNIAKQRNGATGTVCLAFEPKFTGFSNYAAFPSPGE